MQLPPIAVIATWPIPNYTNPTVVRGPAILILTMIFLPITVALAALRTYTRVRLSKNFGADDVALIATLFPTIGTAVLSLIAVFHAGWNVHVWDVPSEQLVMGLKFVMAIEILFVTAASWTKISMLLLINRFMGPGSILLKRVSIGIIVIVVIDNIIYIIVATNTCHPVSLYWTLSFAPQNCINEAAHLLAGGIINTVTDVCVVLIPIPVVMNLKLPLRQRIACALLFGTGFVACFAAAVRMYYTWQLNTTYDKTWLAYPTWICGTFELYLGIIATSLPAIKPLVARYMPKLLGSSPFSSRNWPSMNSYGRSSERTPKGSHMSSQMSTQIITETRVELKRTLSLSSEFKDLEMADERLFGKPSIMTTVTTVTSGHGKPLPSRPPPTSAFSTYRSPSPHISTYAPPPPYLSAFSKYKAKVRGINLSAADSIESRIRSAPAELSSRKTSLSSFHTARPSMDDGSFHYSSPSVRRANSGERLVMGEMRLDVASLTVL